MEAFMALLFPADSASSLLQPAAIIAKHIKIKRQTSLTLPYLLYIVIIYIVH